MSATKENIAENLKNTMSNLPFPIAIVTAAYGKQKRGVTVGSFTSLSMNPPLISFNIDCNSQICSLMERATHYTVHLPLPDDSHLCDHFATSGLTGKEQFSEVDHYRNAYGSPVLNAISTVIQCRAYNKFQAGDHLIMAGEVIEVNQRSKKAGILYYGQSFRQWKRTTFKKAKAS